MAKKMEEKQSIDYSENLELSDNLPLREVPIEPQKIKIDRKSLEEKETLKENSLKSCLRNERVIVRYLPKENGKITDPKHILYGGMAESAVRIFVVPKLSNGDYVNVLTNSEKDYLEYIMGLEYNALSKHKKINNYWDDSNTFGTSKVRLTKQDNYLDLSTPDDYIRYKILIANKDLIAPSIKELQDHPKSTYQFVIISEGDTNKVAKEKMNATMRAYKEFGKIEDNYHKLRTILELLQGKPISRATKIEALQEKINDYIQADSKLFLRTIDDEYLDYKVLIYRCIDAGLIANRGNQYYLIEGNVPLCNFNEEPVLSIASKFLSLPKNQELKFALEAKLKIKES